MSAGFVKSEITPEVLRAILDEAAESARRFAQALDYAAAFARHGDTATAVKHLQKAQIDQERVNGLVASVYAGGWTDTRAALDALVRAYARASEDLGGDGSVDWDDVDIAHEFARRALGRTVCAEIEIEEINRREPNEADIEERDGFVEADADVLKSAGYGTDEDYGLYEGSADE